MKVNRNQIRKLILQELKDIRLPELAQYDQDILNLEILSAEASQEEAERLAAESGYDNIDDYARNEHGYDDTPPSQNDQLGMSAGEKYIEDLQKAYINKSA